MRIYWSASICIDLVVHCKHGFLFSLVLSTDGRLHLKDQFRLFQIHLPFIFSEFSFKYMLYLNQTCRLHMQMKNNLYALFRVEYEGKSYLLLSSHLQE